MQIHKSLRVLWPIVCVLLTLVAAGTPLLTIEAFVGANAHKTFLSQVTYRSPVHGKPGAFMFVADRWNPNNPIDGCCV